MITVKLLRDALAQQPDDNEVLLVVDAADPDDIMTYQIAHIKGHNPDSDEKQTYIILMDY